MYCNSSKSLNTLLHKSIQIEKTVTNVQSHNFIVLDKKIVQLSASIIKRSQASATKIQYLIQTSLELVVRLRSLWRFEHENKQIYPAVSVSIWSKNPAMNKLGLLHAGAVL